MKEDLKDKFIEYVMKPDSKPFLFKKGQVARVLNGISDDGQTPEYWDGAKVIISEKHCSTIFKHHWYKVIHMENSRTCEFKEEELDKRFIRNE